MKVSVRDEKDLLHNAYELLDSGNRWTKHKMMDGGRFCILGALVEETPGPRNRTPENQRLLNGAGLRIRNSIRKLFPERTAVIPSFNDDRHTRWEDVEAVLKDTMK